MSALGGAWARAVAAALGVRRPRRDAGPIAKGAVVIDERTGLIGLVTVVYGDQGAFVMFSGFAGGTVYLELGRLALSGDQSWRPDTSLPPKNGEIAEGSLVIDRVTGALGRVDIIYADGGAYVAFPGGGRMLSPWDMRLVGGQDREPEGGRA